MATCIICGRKSIFLKLDFNGMCEDCVRQKEADLCETMTPDQMEYVDLKQMIRDLDAVKLHTMNEIEQIKANQEKAAQELSVLYNSIQIRKNQIVEMDETILIQEFGLYTPRYEFCKADEYKTKLSVIRQNQKDMVKSGAAVTGSSVWRVDGSAAKGTKMAKDLQKLLLRSFNSECDSIIDNVKYSNFDQSLKRISDSRSTISKLGSVMNLSITEKYYNLKVQELTLAFEYQQKKQCEKEEQKEIRAQMREEAKLQKELEEARRKTEKEQSHYTNALNKVLSQILSNGETPELIAKKAELEAQLQDVSKALEQIDYRQANQRAGYVYVVSNIGSFGENIYKIGMTRRLDPTERIDELGDASVPFDFDIHAMIFSEDAPALEASLHKAFSERKLNMVNLRREFFSVTLDEIKEVVKKNYDKTAEFIDVADAEQYRISQKMRSPQS